MKHLLCAALVMMAGQAQALRCAPSDANDTLGWMIESEQDFSVLYGHFRFDPPLEGDFSEGFQTHRAHFEGVELTPDQRRHHPPLYVTVQISCVNIWCGYGVPEGAPHIAFVLRDAAQGMVLESGPCRGNAFVATDETVASLQARWREIEARDMGETR